MDMKKLILISALLLVASNGWANEAFGNCIVIAEESVYGLEETWNRGADKHLSGHPMIHTDAEQGFTSASKRDAIKDYIELLKVCADLNVIKFEGEVELKE